MITAVIHDHSGYPKTHEKPGARTFNSKFETSNLKPFEPQSTMDMFMGALEYRPDDHHIKPFTKVALQKRSRP